MTDATVAFTNSIKKITEHVFSGTMIVKPGPNSGWVAKVTTDTTWIKQSGDDKVSTTIVDGKIVWSNVDLPRLVKCLEDDNCEVDFNERNEILVNW